jgi:aminoglycoside 6'-N-acetyltransferase I
MIDAYTPGYEAEWLRMRQILWPDCSPEMHRVEMAERKGTGSVIFVYRRDHSKLGGFIEVSLRDRVDGSLSARVGYVEGWYVDEDLRGHGVGRQLIAAAETWAKSKGLTELASDAELPNEDSIRAHYALGFKETFRLVHFIKTIS